MESWHGRERALCQHEKTKFLVSVDGHDVLKKSGKCPCAAWCSGIDSNFILCSQCILWVHINAVPSLSDWLPKKTMSAEGVGVSLCTINGRTVTEVDVDDTMLMSNTHSASWYAVLRWGLWQCHCCQMLCGQFRKVQEILTYPNHHNLIPSIRGKVCEACVCLVMLHGSYTWGPNNPELQQLQHNMIWWICGIKDRHEIPPASLLQKIDITDITSVRQCRKLRWYGHVLYQIYYKLPNYWHWKERRASEDMAWMCEEWCQWVWSSWRWPSRQRCMESRCSLQP